MLVGGQNVGLTQNEYKIVALLGKCAGKVLTYDYIIKELWGPGTRGNNQSLRVHMANIRRKIEKKPGGAAVYLHRDRRGLSHGRGRLNNLPLVYQTTYQLRYNLFISQFYIRRVKQ